MSDEEMKAETDTDEVEEQVSDDSAPSEGEGDSTAAAKSDFIEDDDLPKKVRKRIDKLTAQRHAERERAEALEKQLRELSEKVDTLANPPKPRPSREQYDTEEDYEDALIDWKFQQTQQQKRADQPVATKPVIPDTWEDQVEDATEKYSDFAAVAFNPTLSVTGEMVEVITAMDHGADVLYHLGKNPRLSSEIARMPPLQQARELGKIEARLSVKPTKVTGAPDPIKPVTGDDTPVKDPDKMTADEWLRWRNKQLYG